MLKYALFFVAVFSLGISLLPGCSADLKGPEREQINSIILNVDDVAADPEAYSGIITVAGIVSFVNKSDSIFSIIDVREYELCGIVTCAANQILISTPPDRYSGELPSVEDKVIVSGKMINIRDGYSIEVSEVIRGNNVLLKRIIN